jgi:segregation and condensation protein B
MSRTAAQLTMTDSDETDISSIETSETAAAVEAEVPYVDTGMHLRMLEALLFAAAEPLDEETLKTRLPKEADVAALLLELQALYEPRGVNLVKVSGKWALRTASDLAFLLRKETTEQRRLSRAGIETLAILAYHQPVTRAEIEEIRGVGVSKGTLDLLLEIGWVRPRGRRRTPGRPVTYGTTEAFLQHFGMDRVGDLPGMDELKAAGLLDSSVPAGFAVPSPSDLLSPDEDPLDEADLADLLAPRDDDS